MSFLHDPKVFLKLIESQATTQSSPVSGASPINQIGVAKKLVNKLTRELTSVPEPPNLTIAGMNSDLMVNNLKDLSELLKFIDTQQLMIDGARIAYDGGEASKLARADLDKLAKITVDISRNQDVPGQPETRKWNTSDYWANMDLLIKYVAYLQQKARSMQDNKNDSGKVLEVMVGKIIDQINLYKPNSGLNRNPKSQPGKPNAMPDDTFIDGLEPKVFDPTAAIFINKTTANNDNILKAKDLAGKIALNAWLANSKVISVDPKGAKSAPLDYSDSKADQCIVINVMFKRAKHLESRAATTEEEKAAAFYVRKMQELGPLFIGLDNKACSIGGVVGVGAGAGANGNGTDANSHAAVEGIKKLVTRLPLMVEDVSFIRIRNFFAEYEGITADAGAKNAIDQANKLMADVKTMMKNNAQDVYDLGIDAIQFRNSIGMTPPGRYYAAIIDKLMEIVTLTKYVITTIKAAYVDTKLVGPETAALIYGQVGRVPQSNSFASRNLESLNVLKNQTSSVNQPGKAK